MMKYRKTKSFFIASFIFFILMLIISPIAVVGKTCSIDATKQDDYGYSQEKIVIGAIKYHYEVSVTIRNNNNVCNISASLVEKAYEVGDHWFVFVLVRSDNLEPYQNMKITYKENISVERKVSLIISAFFNKSAPISEQQNVEVSYFIDIYDDIGTQITDQYFNQGNGEIYADQETCCGSFISLCVIFIIISYIVIKRTLGNNGSGKNVKTI